MFDNGGNTPNSSAADEKNELFGESLQNELDLVESAYAPEEAWWTRSENVSSGESADAVAVCVTVHRRLHLHRHEGDSDADATRMILKLELSDLGASASVGVGVTVSASLDGGGCPKLQKRLGFLVGIVEWKVCSFDVHLLILALSW